MSKQSHTFLATGAREANLTSPGLRKIALRAGKLITIDRHAFVPSDWLDEVIQARSVLGLKSARQRGEAK